MVSYLAFSVAVGSKIAKSAPVKYVRSVWGWGSVCNTISKDRSVDDKGNLQLHNSNIFPTRNSCHRRPRI